MHRCYKLLYFVNKRLRFEPFDREEPDHAECTAYADSYWAGKYITYLVSKNSSVKCSLMGNC